MNTQELVITAELLVLMNVIIGCVVGWISFIIWVSERKGY